MHRRVSILAATLLAVIATGARAQTQPMQPMTQEQQEEMQQQQQACGNDVYTLCGDAIPDRDRITACLKQHWKDISADCKSTMENHGKRRGGRKRGTTGSQQ